MDIHTHIHVYIHTGTHIYIYIHTYIPHPPTHTHSPESESVGCSVMSDSMWPHGLLTAGLLCPWNSPGKNTGVVCHSMLQGIFPTQGLNWVSWIAGRFFTSWATWATDPYTHAHTHTYVCRHLFTFLRHTSWFPLSFPAVSFSSGLLSTSLPLWVSCFLVPWL